MKSQSLFDSQESPLADQLRPRNLDDLVGQAHLTGEDGFIRKVLEKESIPSMILWGPPGTGKTTIARIIAEGTEYEFIELSAVSSGVKDIRRVVDGAEKRKEMGESTIIFIDEIHRFNKTQQDALLPHVEKGTITLIGATTENPSFEVVTPLLSRSRVVQLNPLEEKDLEAIIDSATEKLEVSISDTARNILIKLSGGDARNALNALEVAATLSEEKEITDEDIKQAFQKERTPYDKGGEDHYNVISAYIKSLRGSDENAALYYLARMLEGGEDPLFIARRMIIFASEDIGLAGNHALTLAVNAFQAVERIGMPEAQLILSHVTIALAKSKKSRSATTAISKAKRAVKENPGAQVPLHIRNAPTEMMKKFGYGKDYEWKADFKHEKGFLPEELQDTTFYEDDNTA